MKLEKAKMLYKDANADQRYVLECLFPELAEIEDVRIKKEIIEYIKTGTYHKSWIDWIEKQGKQKLADKVEPKFKVGDWILYSGDHYEGVRHITKIDENGYYIERSGLPHGIIPFNHEICMRLWTIQDAKDGDVLANDHHILILRELGYSWAANGNPDSLYAYCGIKPNGNFELEQKGYCFCGPLHTHPATKEQRDLLFQKMKEAGYTFDFEKKELKKIENEIEIPFGAKDSELQEAVYNIPKGFYSVLDGNKVIIKRFKTPIPQNN